MVSKLIAQPSRHAVPTTLIALFAALALLPFSLVAQEPASSTVVPDTLRHVLGFRAPPGMPLDTLVPARALRAPWVMPWRVTPGQRRIEFDSLLDARVAQRRDALATERRLVALRVLNADERAAQDRGLFGLNRQVADFEFVGQLGLEISTNRQRNLACTPLLLQDPLSGCRGGFTAPRIDNVFNLEAAGTIGQRFFLNFDFDTRRDYTNNNVIRVWYQGLPDEMLKRVEVGSTTFRAPPSRFLTAGIPSNNFGVNATFEVGPLELQAIAATQKGSTVAEHTFVIGSETVQPQDRNARDLDFEAGRFFWTVDPRTLPAWPAVDILNAGVLDLAPNVRPVEVRVYRYIAATAGDPAGSYDGITALGINGAERAGPFRWQPLVAGKDYWVDPSGLWFVLSSRVGPTDFLAVSYRTANGGTVGTFPADDDPTRNDQVIIVSAPNRSATSPVFHHAMRQVYRVAGSDLVRSSTKVGVLVARSERPLSGEGTYLSLLGLATASDQGVLDVDNRLFPRFRDPGADQVLNDVFLVYPSAQPFADPRLTTSERNDSLYRTPEYLISTQGPPAKFTMNLQYDARGGGDRGGLKLDAVEMKEESEELMLDGRRLRRGVDYSIEYATGRVTFLDPNTLFGNRQSTITARYEERGFFAVAPTSIAGLTAGWKLGRFGTIHALGLYQAEATAFNRPPLGFEPSASLIGGLVADLRFNAPSVTRFLNQLTGRTTAPSFLSLQGELAFSRPDPNRSGEAYLEEFENDGGRPISLAELAWSPGSRPKSVSGLEAIGIGPAFDVADAVQLIWQNLIPNGRGGVVEIAPQDIDSLIATTASRIRSVETVLYTTLHADTAGGQVDFQNRAHWSQERRDFRPRWRTMTTALSTTGLDLTRNEALEFWVYEGGDAPVEQSRMRMVFDFGSVSEDAVALAPESFTVVGSDTTWIGRQYVGVGKLDTEQSAFGSFNARTDDIGILSDRPDSILDPSKAFLQSLALCRSKLSTDVAVFPWGDLSARCSNGNGGLDTEDLNNDLVLDAQGSEDDVFRYVVDLADPRYFVRDRSVIDQNGRQARWTLYRVPLRTPDVTIGTPDLRLIKHLRVGFVTPPDEGGADPVVRFGLARMRLTGAPWVRRSDRPIAALDGSTAEPRGEVLVSSISTENAELGYVSPPGVRNGPSQIAASNSQVVQQVNEKSLRIIARDLREGERAEGYTRLPTGAQSLQAYRELRVWFRGRGPGWNDAQLQAFVKVGTDASNFYMYRTNARTDSWEPEAVVDLEQWRELRAELEQRVLRNDPPSGADTCGGDPLAYVICEGPYLVHIRDPRVSPPNLGAIQELSTGFIRTGPGAPLTETELWVDDIRLAMPVAEVGIAGAFGARLEAGDVGTIDLLYSHVDGRFRQIGQAPSYRTTGGLSAVASLNLDRFLPQSLGLVIPFQVNLQSGRVDPLLLTGTDIRGASLASLRRPRSHSTTWSISARRTVSSQSSPWMRLLVDPLAVAAARTGASTTTELSESSSALWNASLSYFLSTPSRARNMGLGGLQSVMPKWLAESEAGKGILGGRITPWPTSFRMASALSRSLTDYTSFSVPIERLSDTILQPVSNLQHLWRNDAQLGWQPIGMLSVNTSWGSTRDLRHYADSTSLGRLVGAERRAFLGMDVGVERDRTITSSISLTPRLTSWLRPRFTTGSNFFLTRSLTARNPVRVLGDTAGAYLLPQTINNSRIFELGLSIDPAVLMRRAFGESSGTARAFARVRPVEVTRRRTRQSTFDLATFDPSTEYQLALGGFDTYLNRDGNRATGALNAIEVSASSTMDFPLGLSATVTYTQAENDRYQRLQDQGFLVTSSRTTEWPNGNLSFTRALNRGPLLSIRGGATLRKQTSDARNPSIADAGATRVFSENRSFGPDLFLTFRNGMSLIGGTSEQQGTEQRNGNTTQLDNRRYNASLEWPITLPAMLSRRKKPLFTSVQVVRMENVSCLIRGDVDDCVPFSDIRRWDVRASMRTDLRGSIQAGLQFGWVLNDIRHLERKSSTLSLSMTFNMPLSALEF